MSWVLPSPYRPTRRRFVEPPDACEGLVTVRVAGDGVDFALAGGDYAVARRCIQRRDANLGDRPVVGAGGDWRFHTAHFNVARGTLDRVDGDVARQLDRQLD